MFLSGSDERIGKNFFREDRHIALAFAQDGAGRRLTVDFRFVELFTVETIVDHEPRSADDRNDATIDGRWKQVCVADRNGPKSGSLFCVKYLEKTIGCRNEEKTILYIGAGDFLNIPTKRRLRKPRTGQTCGVRVRFGN